MSREYAAVNVAMWADPEFRNLPPAAQHLYLLLWTSPSLDYCGVHDWRPARLAKLSSGFTAEHISAVADCLVARYFLVVDNESEEVLVRSWARFDGLVKKPRMAVSYASAYAAVASSTLREVLVHETQKMRDLWPELACWTDRRVAELLAHPSTSAKDLPTPSDPFASGFADWVALGLPPVYGPFVANASKGLPPVYTPPTPAPAPAPNSFTPEGASSKRATHLPEDFTPNNTNHKIADERGLDLASVVAQFSDHHRAKGTTYKDWHLALNTWLRREKPGPGLTSARKLPHASEIERAPSGLTDEQMDAWMRGER